MTNPRPSRVRHLLLAVAMVGGIGMVAPKAEACGGGWWPEIEIDYRVEGIARAEKELATGNYFAAAGSVIRMIPHIKGYRAASSDPIVNRSMRVLALAMSRAGGDLTKISRELPEELRAEFVGASADERQANLAWSVKALKAIRKTKKHDATIDSEVAEAMAQLPEKQATAKKVLEKLARKDLLTSPEAYRALAVLRANAGDAAGTETALAQCRNMAKDATHCVAPSVVVGQS